MPLSIGSEAPDVTLFEKTDDKVRSFKLSEYRGKQNIVLLFFPAVYTSVCTVEMCTVRDSIAEYDALDATVIGISGDLPYSQKKWKSELQLNMILGSDHNHDAVKAYDVEYPTWAGGIHGVAKRSVFVIDKKGVLQYQEVLESADDLPSFDGMKGALKKLA